MGIASIAANLLKKGIKPVVNEAEKSVVYTTKQGVSKRLLFDNNGKIKFWQSLNPNNGEMKIFERTFDSGKYSSKNFNTYCVKKYNNNGLSIQETKEISHVGASNNKPNIRVKTMDAAGKIKHYQVMDSSSYYGFSSTKANLCKKGLNPTVDYENRILSYTDKAGNKKTLYFDKNHSDLRFEAAGSGNDKLIKWVSQDKNGNIKTYQVLSDTASEKLSKLSKMNNYKTESQTLILTDRGLCKGRKTIETRDALGKVKAFILEFGKFSKAVESYLFKQCA